MRQTTDIALFNSSIMTFNQNGITRKSKKTRQNKRPFQCVLPTIHEDTEYLWPVAATMISGASARASSRTTTLSQAEIAALFKRRRLAVERIRNKMQCSSSSSSSSTTIWV
jgi:hypothetical protein